MSKTFFEIGDQIWPPVFGTGYIAGPPLPYQYTDELGIAKTTYRYLAYFHENKPYIAYVISPKLKKSADTNSIQLVQRNIMSVLIPSVQDGKYKIGDIVHHKYSGIGLMLSNNHMIPGLAKQPEYHIYYKHDSSFELNNHADLTLIQRADKATHQQALKILSDKILAPILAATVPIDPNKPTDDMLIKLMNTPIPF